MINRAEFRFNDSISIDVASEVSSTTIYLKMRGIHSEQTSLYPISGFPRSLIAEDKIKGTSLAITIIYSLKHFSERRLDKRTELIKERRYGGLAVASETNVASAGHNDNAPETPNKGTQNNISQTGEEITSPKAEGAETPGSRTSVTSSTGRTIDSRASSQTLVPQLSRESSSSASKALFQGVPIADLRAQAEAAAHDGLDGLITIKDGDELTKTMSAMLSSDSKGAGIGMEGPDFGSDDSDGPPSEQEEEGHEAKEEGKEEEA